MRYGQLRCLYASTIPIFSFFFYKDTATTEIYTLSLHDALPICWHLPRVVEFEKLRGSGLALERVDIDPGIGQRQAVADPRSEEHTSELQSLTNLVCRLLLEKKKQTLMVYSAHLGDKQQRGDPVT